MGQGILYMVSMPLTVGELSFCIILCPRMLGLVAKKLHLDGL